LIIGGSASQKLAAMISKEMDDELCPVETKKFPDGERYVRIKGEIEKEMTVVQSTAFPQDENIMELLFLINNLKDLGAEEIKVVVPYMGYARQEKRFKTGETISARIIANLIEKSGATKFYSVNLHEESVLNFFNIPCKNISAMKPIAEYIKEKTDNPIIVGPDKGALNFAEEIADILNCESTYLQKTRISPEKVETKIVKMRYDFNTDDPEFKNKKQNVDISTVEGKEAVIIDDIISTGGTIVNAINILKDHGAKTIDVCCVHPVLVNDAILKLYSAGIRNLAGTNTIKSEVSEISLATEIAKNIK
jgi:ribose-phosphate pyrophosphokinase